MSEMGLEQEQATTIYQDNEAAIQIALNRGALSKQSRHIERRILTARNKIEDGAVMPKHCVTGKMLGQGREPDLSSEFSVRRSAKFREVDWTISASTF